MMANGESVIPVPGTDYHILWRKACLLALLQGHYTKGCMLQAMVDPGKNWSSYVTLVDLCPELFGLSTLWLGTEYYSLKLSLRMVLSMLLRHT